MTQAPSPMPQARRVLTCAEASELAANERGLGRVVAFTNGVFDLLHPGHVRYLRDARALGDLLIVGINSDRSVRALAKAPDRPINSEHERAEVLAALASVDAVVVFDEDTPHAIISALQPDILVKGADWGENEIVGRDVVEARGGRVVRVQLADGYSTTSLIERIRAPR
jgi:rfaE bifunctional protein nucleotidyltransferase chain/domain